MNAGGDEAVTPEERRARQCAYAATYRAAHREKIRAYYQRNREERSAYNAAYYRRNRERIAAQRAAKKGAES